MSEEEKLTGDGALLEPLAAYRQIYRESFRRNCEEYFDGLVKESGVDVEGNRSTVKAYNARLRKIAEIEKRLSKLKGIRGFFIFLIVFGGIALAAGIFLMVKETYVVGAVMLALGAAFCILFPVLLAKKIVPVLKEAERKREEQRGKAEALKEEGFRQTAPLNALFEGNASKKLIEKTVPLIKTDDNFNMRRYDYLSGKYGYGLDDDPEISTIGILTGEILGNPFVEERLLVHSMGTCVYSGSIVIHWTTTHTDAKGNLVTDHHSQTLTATVNKPKPYYTRRTRLVYGNEAAPDLHFSRSPAHTEDLSEKARERKVKRGAKALRKKQENAVARKGGFTQMGNEEFDILFGATDRDDEVQFRLLFTPLAQKNMLALLTDDKGFGDDFAMRKSGCLNYVSSEHSARWDMDEDRTRYFSFGVDLAKEKFLAFQTQYFENLYFDLAPILSIPLYQQHKPKEYLYREEYPRSYTRQETECSVNRMNVFAPEGAATECILKTSFLSGRGKSDFVKVTAHSYLAFDRVDYVPVRGGDGRVHEVPVPWTEYVPTERERMVGLKELGLSDRDFARASEGTLKSALAKFGGSGCGYTHGIVCCVLDEEDETFDESFTLEK